MKSIAILFAALAIAASSLSSGCKSLPTAETMKSTATAIGVAAGLVANSTKIDDKARNTIIEIMGQVATVIPKEGQSFEDAWTPVAKEVVAKLVADGKIDEAVGNIALAAFAIGVKGIDYIFDVRYPKARKYEELVSAAISGFTEGFLTVFKPANARATELKPDKDAYEWLKKQSK